MSSYAVTYIELCHNMFRRLLTCEIYLYRQIKPPLHFFTGLIHGGWSQENMPKLELGELSNKDHSAPWEENWVLTHRQTKLLNDDNPPTLVTPTTGYNPPLVTVHPNSPETLAPGTLTGCPRNLGSEPLRSLALDRSAPPRTVPWPKTSNQSATNGWLRRG